MVRKRVSSHFFVVIVDEVEEHEACFQFDGRLAFAVTNVAILLFLLFCGEEEFQTAMLIELNQPWFVVGIDNEETAAGLVALAAEPRLHIVNNLTAKVQVLIAMVNTKTTKKYGREVLTRLFRVNLCAYYIAPTP